MRDNTNIDLRENENITLTAKESTLFVEAFLNPAPINAAIKRAFERHKGLLG